MTVERYQTALKLTQYCTWEIWCFWALSWYVRSGRVSETLTWFPLRKVVPMSARVPSYQSYAWLLMRAHAGQLIIVRHVSGSSFHHKKLGDERPTGRRCTSVLVLYNVRTCMMWLVCTSTMWKGARLPSAPSRFCRYVLHLGRECKIYSDKNIADLKTFNHTSVCQHLMCVSTSPSWPLAQPCYSTSTAADVRPRFHGGKKVSFIHNMFKDHPEK